MHGLELNTSVSIYYFHGRRGKKEISYEFSVSISVSDAVFTRSDIRRHNQISNGCNLGLNREKKSLKES